MISYDADVTVTPSEYMKGTVLTIAVVSPWHSGNYTCSPPPLTSASVDINVIDEDDKSSRWLPAAVASDATNISISNILMAAIAVFLA